MANIIQKQQGALQNGRRAIGIELKPSYYQQAVRNCENVTESEQISLW